eukprot:30828-Pelagococcus_subviridis.AAC.23
MVSDLGLSHAFYDELLKTRGVRSSQARAQPRLVEAPRESRATRSTPSRGRRAPARPSVNSRGPGNRDGGAASTTRRRGGGRLGHFVDTTRGEGGRRRGDDGDAPVDALDALEARARADGRRERGEGAAARGEAAEHGRRRGRDDDV